MIELMLKDSKYFILSAEAFFRMYVILKMCSVIFLFAKMSVTKMSLAEMSVAEMYEHQLGSMMR